ncbi:hypothetical protein N9J84_03100, partial [Porticoccaceae bacterium]|nr:hypothetical protein [Porticoccaceae bacterium]
LPLSDREAILVDLPVSYEDSQTQSFPEVRLRSHVGDLTHEWQGRIVRTDASIDVQSRMTFAVAEVKNPFRADPTDDRPPLSIGLFVEADIDGKVIENALRLPKDSVYRGREILVLNDQDQVYFQPVSIVRSDSSSVVAVGVRAGTKIVTTRISLPINGMKVEPQLNQEPQLGQEPQLNQEPQQTQQSPGGAS